MLSRCFHFGVFEFLFPVCFFWWFWLSVSIDSQCITFNQQILKKKIVMVIAESTESENQKRGQKPKKVGHIKMIVVPNLRMVTIDGEAVNAIEPDSSITTDAIKDGLSGISGEENPVESVSIAKLKEMKNRLSSGYTSFWS